MAAVIKRSDKNVQQQKRIKVKRKSNFCKLSDAIERFDVPLTVRVIPTEQSKEFNTSEKQVLTIYDKIDIDRVSCTTKDETPFNLTVKRDISVLGTFIDNEQSYKSVKEIIMKRCTEVIEWIVVLKVFKYKEHIFEVGDVFQIKCTSRLYELRRSLRRKKKLPIIIHPTLEECSLRENIEGEFRKCSSPYASCHQSLCDIIEEETLPYMIQVPANYHFNELDEFNIGKRRILMNESFTISIFIACKRSGDKLEIHTIPSHINIDVEILHGETSFDALGEDDIRLIKREMIYADIDYAGKNTKQCFYEDIVIGNEKSELPCINLLANKECVGYLLPAYLQTGSNRDADSIYVLPNTELLPRKGQMKIQLPDQEDGLSTTHSIGNPLQDTPSHINNMLGGFLLELEDITNNNSSSRMLHNMHLEAGDDHVHLSEKTKYLECHGRNKNVSLQRISSGNTSNQRVYVDEHGYTLPFKEFRSEYSSIPENNSILSQKPYTKGKPLVASKPNLSPSHKVSLKVVSLPPPQHLYEKPYIHQSPFGMRNISSAKNMAMSLPRNFEMNSNPTVTNNEILTTSTPSLQQVISISKISNLSVSQVTNLLKAVALHHRIEAFQRSEIDGCLLVELDEESLIELNLTKFEARKLHRYVNGWRAKKKSSTRSSNPDDIRNHSVNELQEYLTKIKMYNLANFIAFQEIDGKLFYEFLEDDILLSLENDHRVPFKRYELLKLKKRVFEAYSPKL